ncbi:hypothetical protein Hanom_Chr03g00249681 [Helianthus anomalus]
MTLSKQTTLCIMLIFVSGMAKFPQVSYADAHIPCQNVKDCPPDICPPHEYVICIFHACVCIKTDVVRAIAPTTRNIDKDIDGTSKTSVP